MTKTIVGSAVLAAMLMSLTACGDDSDGSGGGDSGGPSTVAIGETGEIGTEFDGEASSADITVSAVSVEGDDSPWLAATMEVENTGDNPIGYEASIYCDGSDEGGGWQADSTLDMSADVEPGDTAEGVLNLLVPGDSRTGEEVPECATPAYIQVEPTGVYEDDPQTLQVTLPDDVIDELNSGHAAAK